MIYKNKELINKKSPKIILLFTYINILIVIVLITYTLFYEIKTYKNGQAVIIKDENYYLKINITLKDIKTIIRNDEIIINKTKYKYKIKDISNIKYSDNLINYQTVLLSIENLDEKYKITNLVINYKILKEKEKLIK